MMNQEENDKNNEETESELHIGEDSGEMLNCLIEEYGMNTNSLSKVLDIESAFLDDFNENKNNIPMEKRVFFNGILDTLYYIPKITPDERNRAIIDGLTEEYHISIYTIARMADVRKEDIENFMNRDNSISDNIKYKIATVSMFLHFIFKPSDDKFKLTKKAIKAGLNDESINKLTGATYEEIELFRRLCE